MSEQSSRGRASVGARGVIVLSVAGALVLCLGAAVWMGQRSPEATSVHLEATPSHSPAPSADEAALEPQQIEAVKDFATSAFRSGDASFLVSMGVAVPQGVALQDMPRALGDALPAYINDQYVVVANRFVIVARSTRRIIAIVPTG
ncbi:DUF1236 domain-containing protein [Microbacteriaceae bacterium K1510]|nr:DUF1236 domain-containing protein [Microbacteriaceae bacterium K1510]